MEHSKDTHTVFFRAYPKEARICESSMSSTAGAKSELPSNTAMGTSPYEKGRMSSFCRRAAWEASTLSPVLKSSTSFTISMTPGNLGGDVESLEERGHRRLERSDTLGHNHADLRHGTSLGRGGLLLGGDHVTDDGEGVVGEHESDVQLASLTDLLELSAALLLELADDTAHLGVLTA